MYDELLKNVSPDLSGAPCLIPLSNGGFTLVDYEDLDLVSSYRWRAMRTHRNTYYVTAEVWHPTTKTRETIYMHRLIMDAPSNMDVDHINRDTLDNRRANLQIMTRSANAAKAQNEMHRTGFSGADVVSPLAPNFSPQQAQAA